MWQKFKAGSEMRSLSFPDKFVRKTKYLVL